MSTRRYAVSGAVAGGVSTLAFTVIHDLFISDIWFSLFPMLVAGALCGLCIGWSYALLVPNSSVLPINLGNIHYTMIPI